MALATDCNNWPGAHDLFSRIRRRGPLNAKDYKEGDSVRMSQYTSESCTSRVVHNQTILETRLIRVPRTSSRSLPFCWHRTVSVPEQDVLAIVVACESRNGTLPPRFAGPAPTAAANACRSVRPQSKRLRKSFPTFSSSRQVAPDPTNERWGRRCWTSGLSAGPVPDVTSNATKFETTVTPTAGHRACVVSISQAGCSWR